MALLPIKPGSIEIISAVTTRGYVAPGTLKDVPGGLFPMKTAAFEVDEYRLLEGWPVPVPPCDIHCDSLVSGDGQLLADRQPPTSVLTGADYRWIADSDFYSQTALQWLPIQGSEPIWTAPTDHLPTLVHDYEYTVGEERFTEMSALNFDSDTADYLTTDLARAMSTDKGYSVIMVMSPNSLYGNNVEVPYNSLWCNPPDPPQPAPPLPRLPVNRIALKVRLKDFYLRVALTDSADQQGIAMSQATSISAPSYLAVVINRPNLTMYLGQGPKNIAAKKLNVGPPSLTMSTVTLLGKDPADNDHCADMALFDLGLYATPLSAEAVATEFALLSKIYGGD